MPRLIVVTREGAERVIETAAGASVMKLIRDGGVDELLALCGGSCACATCHVHVDAAFFDRLPAMQEGEYDLLHCLDNWSATSRLSCQIPFTSDLDGMRVTVADED
jgi:2Fe-2S ferredoxin